MKKRSKLGQAGLDVLSFVVILFFISVLSLIAVKIWNGLDNTFQSTTSLPAESKTASSTAASNIPEGLDFGIVVGLGLLYIGLYVTTRNIGTDPNFFFINVCLLILVLGFSAILSNTYEGTNISEFTIERASMPASVYIGSHLLEFSIGAVAIVLIGLFAKPGGT